MIPRSSKERKLNSAEMDLQVLVGKSQQLFTYNSAVLASYSSYVSTMLAMPMKEQRTRTLHFLEIDVEDWEYMIKLHEPGGTRKLKVERLLDLIPYLDQYQFRLLDFADDFLANFFRQNVYHKNRPKVVDTPQEDLVIRVAKLCSVYSSSLPQVLTEAKRFVQQCMFDPNEIGPHFDLIYLFDHDEDTIQTMVSSILGKRTLDITEMKSEIQKDEFEDAYLLKLRQLSEMDKIFSHIGKFMVQVRDAGNDLVNGVKSKTTKNEDEYT